MRGLCARARAPGRRLQLSYCLPRVRRDQPFKSPALAPCSVPAFALSQLSHTHSSQLSHTHPALSTMSGAGRGKGKTAGKKAVSRSSKAGLQFPVGRIARCVLWLPGPLPVWQPGCCCPALCCTPCSTCALCRQPHRHTQPALTDPALSTYAGTSRRGAMRLAWAPARPSTWRPCWSTCARRSWS